MTQFGLQGLRRPRLRHLLWLGVALLLLVWVLRSASLGQVLATLQQLTWPEVAALILVNTGLFAVFAGRWWLFLRAQGYPIPFLRLLLYRLTAFGISYFTPGPHFGGEPYQVYAVVRRHAVPAPAAVAAVTLDKLLEMLVNFLFLMGGVLLLLTHQRGLAPWLEQQLAFTSLLLLALPCGLLLALALGYRPLTGLLQAIEQRARRPLLPPAWAAAILRSEAQTSLLCREHPRVLLAALGVSTLSWIGLIGEFWLVTSVLGLGLSFVDAATALVAARVAILLPVPAGLGALEASQALAMRSLGLDLATGVAISLMIRARDVTFGLLGLWVGGVHVWQQAAAATAFWQAQPVPVAAGVSSPEPAHLIEEPAPIPPA